MFYLTVDGMYDVNSILFIEGAAQPKTPDAPVKESLKGILWHLVDSEFTIY